MSRRIERYNDWAGSGMMNTPERLEELEHRRAQHARLIRGKPEKTFGELLDEKMRGRSNKDKGRDEGQGGEGEEDTPKKGAIDPHMGLSPGQDASLAKGGKGRRAGRVIVKG